MGYFNKNRFSLRQVVLLLTIAFVGTAVISYAAVTIPNTFTSGTTISASQVNDNFTKLNNSLPVFASGKYNGQVNLTAGSTTMQDVVLTTITIPANGTIVVEAAAQAGITGANTTMCAINYQIDETSGGVYQWDQYATAGFETCPQVSSTTLFMPLSAKRVYQKTAGTYTFRLEAADRTAVLNGGRYLFNPIITATYYPAP